MLRLVEAFCVTLVICAASSVVRAEVVDSRTIERTLQVSSGENVTVIVDNVFGRVAVTGHDGNDVELRATETVRGDLRGDIDRAHAEVELEVEQEPGRIAFRVRRKDGCDCRFERWDGYVVAYDIELGVPRRAALDLSTVNEGDVVVNGVHGDFELANVNGAVEVSGARGSGRIATVNGRIGASFERAPSGDTVFKTVNGDVEVALPKDVAANLDVESSSGDVFTDFELVSVGAAVRAAPGRGLRLLSKPRSARFRVAAGGPTYSFSTLNGDIYVRKVNK
jgi:hypothetical protein